MCIVFFVCMYDVKSMRILYWNLSNYSINTINKTFTSFTQLNLSHQPNYNPKQTFYYISHKIFANFLQTINTARLFDLGVFFFLMLWTSLQLIVEDRISVNKRYLITETCFERKDVGERRWKINVHFPTLEILRIDALCVRIDKKEKER